MGFNNRTPTPLDPATDPLLPQADSSQAHDIPTGVSPTTAKIQDWIAWLSNNGVFYDSLGNVEIDGDLTVTGAADITGDVNMGAAAAVGTDLDVGNDIDVGGQIVLSGTQPASNADPGAHSLHSTNVAKVWAFVETDGAGGTTIHDAFNVTSATVTGSAVRITFVRGFANSNFSAVVTSGNGGDFAVVVARNAAYVDVSMYAASSPGTPLDPAAFFLRFNLLVHGRHT